MVSAALLRMDPAIPGSLSALLEMSRGATLRHYHTFDEQVVVIEGMVRHLSEGSPDAGPMPTGSYWFQPAGAVHQDICASDRCIIFVYQHSGGDTIVAPSD
jgi:quercetin dioxygenase-like cupin family protein